MRWTRGSRTLGSLVLVVAAVAGATPAGASTTAAIQIVDHYGHGPVKVWVNRTTHKLADDQRTGWFAVTPSSSHNDGISVQSMRYSGCRMGEPGWFFHTGHQYRIVIFASQDRCSIGRGKTMAGPEFRVIKVS